MRGAGKIIGVFLISAALTLGAPATAYATLNPGGPKEGQVNGNSNGSGLSASVTNTRIRITTSGDQKVPTGKVTSVDPNWTPPVCWYEPVLTPEQLSDGVDTLEKSGGLANVTPSLSWYYGLFRDYYEKDKPHEGITSYKNFNLDKQGKGMWWRGVVNPNRQNEYDPFVSGCDELMFWVDDGTTPNRQKAISPEVLAGYAYDSINVPITDVKMNPAGGQTVNLPTWIWAKDGRYKPISVRAELPGTGLWAETTAEPVAVHIDPGTPDATLFPASGDCPIDTSGNVGTEYTSGATGDPSCGVVYRRMTNGTPYAFKVSVTWKITWTGSDGTRNKSLPDGTFFKISNVDVREVQTVNR